MESPQSRGAKAPLFFAKGLKMDVNTIIQLSGFGLIIIGYVITAIYRSSSKRVNEGRQEQILNNLASEFRRHSEKIDLHIVDVKENYAKKNELDKIADRIEDVRKEVKVDFEDYKKHISDQYTKSAHVETLVKAQVGEILANKRKEN